MYDSMSSPAIFSCGNSPTKCPAMVPPNSQPDRSLSCTTWANSCSPVTSGWASKNPGRPATR